MEKYSAFCQTCTGASHIKRNIVCQDSSLAVNSEKFTLAAVADGHGSAQYIRTHIGSQLAVKSAAECVREFMESLDNAAERLKSEKERKIIFSQLWRSIVSRWHDYAEEDFRKNPFSEDELVNIPQNKAYYREKYMRGDCLAAYGTTLLAAVVSEDFAFGMQIGDGSLAAVGEDASVWEPIPPDSRCHDSVTTSMCQDDAVLSGRFCYFAKDEIPPAIFLGSDGVDDSYWVKETLYRFYAGLALTFAESGLDEGKRQLTEFLPKLTQNGSGDDVSVAGIINQSRLTAAESTLRSAVEKGTGTNEESEKTETEVNENIVSDESV